MLRPCEAASLPGWAPLQAAAITVYSWNTEEWLTGLVRFI